MAKQLVGVVTSDKAEKTITVAVSTRRSHPIYKKQYSETKKFLVHDESNSATTGDRVSIIETKPRSARKRFELLKIIEKPALREQDLKIESEKDITTTTTKKTEDTSKKATKKKTDHGEEE